MAATAQNFQPDLARKKPDLCRFFCNGCRCAKRKIHFRHAAATLADKVLSVVSLVGLESARIKGVDDSDSVDGANRLQRRKYSIDADRVNATPGDLNALMNLIRSEGPVRFTKRPDNLDSWHGHAKSRVPKGLERNFFERDFSFAARFVAGVLRILATRGN